MRLSRLKFILSTILVAGVAGAFYFHSRREEIRLRNLQGSIRSLRLDNQRLAAIGQSSQAGRSVTDQKTTNAAALSREIVARQSRTESPSDPQYQLRPGLIPVGTLTYVGQSSPLAAVESGFWAIYHGDLDQLAKLIALTPDGTDAAATLFASMPPDAQAALQTPERMMALLVAYSYDAAGYQVLGSNQNSNDPSSWTVHADVQLADGRTIRPSTTLQETNGIWQVQFDQNAVKQFGIFLTGAVVPSPVSDR
jgi:hypothetical protein